MRTLSVAALFAAMLLLAAPAMAQMRQDEQVWVNLTAMGPLSGDIVYFAEVQPRVGDGSSRLEMLLLRGAIGAQIRPDMILYQGYARVITPVDDGRDFAEHRGFQQLSWSLGKALGGEFSSRTRLEQRWRSNSGDVGFRLREMLRFETPLKTEGKGPSALVWSEAFVALNGTDWGARAGFDQIRNFVGVEVPVGGKSTVEAGYLNHYVDQAGPRSAMNHVASLTLFLRR